MKTINKIGLLIFSLPVIFSLWSCVKADPEFVHNTNTIAQMYCKASHSAGEYLGEIFEYDKAGNLVTWDFTQPEVEGGYGLILFKISLSLRNDVDLSNIFLTATVTYDEFITPSLSGKHDITGDGIIITVTSGVGTTRQYRVRGEYE